jgi:hypothetical protein
MTPQINPAFAKYVTSVLPELPAHLVANKYKLANLAAGKTTSGAVRKNGSCYTRRWKRKK